MFCGLLVWLAMLATAVGLQAADFSAEFEQANKLYEQGKYSEAAAAYEKLIQSGKASAALYFNEGNALFKTGQIGRAIAAYRRAEQLSPRDPDLRANLQFARAYAQSGASAQTNLWRRWLATLNVNEWTLLTAGAFWLLFLLLALTQWRPTLKGRLRSLTFGVGAAAAVLSVCLGVTIYENGFSKSAIVIAREAVVRNGPLDESQSAYTVRDGAELSVLDEKDDWLQVSDAGRRIGWLRRDAVVIFGHASSRAEVWTRSPVNS